MLVLFGNRSSYILNSPSHMKSTIAPLVLFACCLTTGLAADSVVVFNEINYHPLQPAFGPDPSARDV